MLGFASIPALFHTYERSVMSHNKDLSIISKSKVLESQALRDCVLYITLPEKSNHPGQNFSHLMLVFSQSQWLLK